MSCSLFLADFTRAIMACLVMARDDSLVTEGTRVPRALKSITA